MYKLYTLKKFIYLRSFNEIEPTQKVYNNGDMDTCTGMQKNKALREWADLSIAYIVKHSKMLPYVCNMVSRYI